MPQTYTELQVQNTLTNLRTERMAHVDSVKRRIREEKKTYSAHVEE